MSPEASATGYEVGEDRQPREVEHMSSCGDQEEEPAEFHEEQDGEQGGEWDGEWDGEQNVGSVAGPLCVEMGDGIPSEARLRVRVRFRVRVCLAIFEP